MRHYTRATASAAPSRAQRPKVNLAQHGQQKAKIVQEVHEPEPVALGTHDDSAQPDNAFDSSKSDELSTF